VDGVRGDQDLELAAYEVFHLGAAELENRKDGRTCSRHSSDLFDRFSVTSADGTVAIIEQVFAFYLPWCSV